MAISAEDKNFLVSLYVGYFNRAPDPAGLQFWIDQVEAGRDTNTIAADFAASPEAKSLYPFLTTPDVSSPTSFITAVYANLFNRAPDAAGQAFWEAQLSSGAVSPADAIDAIIKGATTAPDATILANKNIVGLDFATDAGNTPGFTFDLDGASGSAAKDAISGVTEDSATVTAAQAATDAYLSGIASPGQTFTLTTGSDDLTGTAANDVFNAPSAQDGDGSLIDTLQSVDAINGGNGTDRLNATVQDTDIALSSTSVENMFFRFIDNDTVDLAAATGVEQVWTDRSTDDADIDNVQNAVTLGVTGVAAAVDFDLEYANNALGSATHNQAIVLAGAGTAANQVSISVSAGGTDAITGASITAASGVNNVELDGALEDLSSLTIAGSAALTVTEGSADFDDLETLDASSFTGDLDIDISGATSVELSATTGAGDDRLVIDGDLLIAANDEIAIDLGEGSNTLALTNIDNETALGTLVFDEATVSGVNTLELIDAITLTADGTLDLDGIAPESFVFGGAVALGTNTLALDNAPAEALDLTFEGALDNGTLELGDTATGATITAEGVVGGTSTVTVAGEALTEVTANLEANADIAVGATEEALETVTIDASGNGSTVSAAVNGVTADEVSASTLNLTDSSEDGDATIEVTLDDTFDLTSIVLTGGTDSAVGVTAADADYDSAVTINISSIGVDADGNLSGGVAYANDTTTVREIFQFTGDNIGNVIIDNDASNLAVDGASFEAGVGGTADRLDFSQFAAVTGLDDLAITFDGSDTLITAADDQFDGTITVAGVDLSTDAVNFVF